MERFAGDCGYPPGMSVSDIDRGVSPMDDLSPRQRWDLLDDESRWAIYRAFFRSGWDEIASVIDDCESSSDAARSSASLGESLRTLWRSFRDAAVR